MFPRTARRRTALQAATIGLILLAGTAAPARAIVPIPPEPWVQPIPPRTPVQPHEGAELCQRTDVLCPDIAMRAPYQLIPDTWHSWDMLRAANAVLSIGAGPIEVRGTRTGPGRMDAVQYVHRTGGKRSLAVPGGAGNIVFKPIPGQGGYWKFANAAKFELWSTATSHGSFATARSSSTACAICAASGTGAAAPSARSTPPARATASARRSPSAPHPAGPTSTRRPTTSSGSTSPAYAAASTSCTSPIPRTGSSRAMRPTTPARPACGSRWASATSHAANRAAAGVGWRARRPATPPARR